MTQVASDLRRFNAGKAAKYGTGQIQVLDMQGRLLGYLATDRGTFVFETGLAADREGVQDT